MKTFIVITEEVKTTHVSLNHAASGAKPVLSVTSGANDWNVLPDAGKNAPDIFAFEKTPYIS